MKPSLEVGLTFEMRFRIPATKTVPYLYPEAPEFQEMPEVLATGFMVGLVEWACLRALVPHLDWPLEQSVGVHVNLSHVAPTPPGMWVTVTGEVTGVDGRRVRFSVAARDEHELISQGTHERFVIDRDRFLARVREKAARA